MSAATRQVIQVRLVQEDAESRVFVVAIGVVIACACVTSTAMAAQARREARGLKA